MLKVQTYVFNLFYENTYLIWEDDAKEAAIIDPGCNDEEEENTIKEFLAAQKLTLKYLINTHCHIDHILGNAFIKKTYKSKFIAPEKDVFLLERMNEQAELFGIKLVPSPKPDEYIDENVPFILGNVIGRFLYTPGHTPGEFCLYFDQEKICFTGDVLFKENIGRTDLWGGDYEQLIHSINSKLLCLPEDVTIYSGHGDTSTIGHEKKFNSFLKEI